MSPHGPSPKRTQRAFMAVAAAYGMGVLLLSAWTYRAHRAHLLALDDKLMSDAVYAARELLEPLLPTAHATAELRGHLSRLARHCDLSAVGFGTESAPLLLVEGPDPSTPVDEEAAHAWTADLDSTALPGTVTFHTTRHAQHDPTRVAALRAEGADTPTYFVARAHAPTLALIRSGRQRAIVTGAALLLLVIPLLALHTRAQKSVAAQLAAMNERLRKEVDGQKRRERELKDAIQDLGRYTRVSAGREERIIELKGEVNTLLARHSEPPRYHLNQMD